MSADRTELGRCPECNGSIPAGELVIDYESARGQRVTAAKCPSCVTVVTLVRDPAGMP